MLSEAAGTASNNPELATLRAESELRTGHPRVAHDWLREVLPAVERSGDRVQLRRAVNLSGVADIEIGALADAERTFGRALDLARQDGDDLLVARATNNLGAIANIRGERDQALTFYQLAIPAYQRLGSVVGLAESYHNIALTYRQLGAIAHADDYEQRAIAYAQQSSNRALLALALLGRAEIAMASGDAVLAEAGAKRAAATFAGIPDYVREGDACRLIGAAALALGKTTESRAAIDRAIDLAREYGNALNEAEAIQVRAELEASLGELSRSRGDAERALAIFERIQAAPQREALLDWMARVLKA